MAKPVMHKRRRHWQWDALGYAATWCDEIVDAGDACNYWKDAECKHCLKKRPEKK